MIQFTLVHVGFSIGAANLISSIYQSSASHWRLQTIRGELATCQSGLASIHGHNLDGFSLRAIGICIIKEFFRNGLIVSYPPLPTWLSLGKYTCNSPRLFAERPKG